MQQGSMAGEIACVARPSGRRARAARMRAWLVLFVVIPLGSVTGGCAMFIEEPEYTVLERHKAFQLRRYAPYVVAEVEVSGAFSEVGRRAFPVLARYIGGANRERRDISMTVPVQQAPAAGDDPGGRALGAGDRTEQRPSGSAESPGVFVLGFVMPRKYQRVEELPEPTDPRVRLRRVDARLVAALRYTGRWTEARYRAREDRLLEAVRAAGLEPVAAPVFARYNPPSMPSFLRRNEILVEVDRR